MSQDTAVDTKIKHIRSQIVRKLTAHFITLNDRRDFLSPALSNKARLAEVEFEGSAAKFTPRLVNLLSSSELKEVLEYLKGEVGQHDDINKLITEIDSIGGDRWSAFGRAAGVADLPRVYLAMPADVSNELDAAIKGIKSHAEHGLVDLTIRRASSSQAHRDWKLLLLGGLGDAHKVIILLDQKGQALLEAEIGIAAWRSRIELFQLKTVILCFDQESLNFARSKEIYFKPNNIEIVDYIGLSEAESTQLQKTVWDLSLNDDDEIPTTRLNALEREIASEIKEELDLHDDELNKINLSFQDEGSDALIAKRRLLKRLGQEADQLLVRSLLAGGLSGVVTHLVSRLNSGKKKEQVFAQCHTLLHFLSTSWIPMENLKEVAKIQRAVKQERAARPLSPISIGCEELATIACHLHWVHRFGEQNGSAGLSILQPEDEQAPLYLVQPIDADRSKNLTHFRYQIIDLLNPETEFRQEEKERLDDADEDDLDEFDEEYHDLLEEHGAILIVWTLEMPLDQDDRFKDLVTHSYYGKFIQFIISPGDKPLNWLDPADPATGVQVPIKLEIDPTLEKEGIKNINKLKRRRKRALRKLSSQ